MFASQLPVRLPATICPIVVAKKVSNPKLQNVQGSFGVTLTTAQQLPIDDSTLIVVVPLGTLFSVYGQLFPVTLKSGTVV
jgi:hypothetical protein